MTETIRAVALNFKGWRQDSANGLGRETTVEQESAGQKRGERVRRLILETAIELVFDAGFRSVSVESIAAKVGVAKTTVYRRWPNKAAVVMDAFMMRVGSGTLFPPARKVMDRVRQQMHAMAKVFTGKD